MGVRFLLFLQGLLWTFINILQSLKCKNMLRKILSSFSIIFMGVAVLTGCSKKEEKKDTASQVKNEVAIEMEEIEKAPLTELKYVGKINGKYPIHLIVSADRQTGAYYYDKSGASNYMRIRINKFEEDGDVEFDEYNADGERTGRFVGKVTPEGIVGEGTFFTGKTMPFELTVYEGDDEFPSTDWDLTTLSDYEKPSAASEGDSSIDELLDLYEDYIDDYVDCVKSGDVSKLVSLQKKANDIVSKLGKVSGEMTPSQQQRMADIAAKAADSLN